MPDPMDVWISEVEGELDTIDTALSVIRADALDLARPAESFSTETAQVLRALRRWGTSRRKASYARIHDEMRRADRGCLKLLLDIEIVIRKDLAVANLPTGNLIRPGNIAQHVSVRPDGDLNTSWASLHDCEVNCDQLGVSFKGILELFGSESPFWFSAALGFRVRSDSLQTELTRLPVVQVGGTAGALPAVTNALQDKANSIPRRRFSHRVDLPADLKNPVDDQQLPPIGFTTGPDCLTIPFRGSTRSRQRVDLHTTIPNGIDIAIFLHSELLKEAVVRRVGSEDPDATVDLNTFSMNTSDSSITIEVEKYVKMEKRFKKKKWGVTIYDVTVGVEIWARAKIKVTFPIVAASGGYALDARIQQVGNPWKHRRKVKPGWATRIPGVGDLIDLVIDLAIQRFSTPIDVTKRLFRDPAASFMEYYVRPQHVEVNISR